MNCGKPDIGSSLGQTLSVHDREATLQVTFSYSFHDDNLGDDDGIDDIDRARFNKNKHLTIRMYNGEIIDVVRVNSSNMLITSPVQWPNVKSFSNEMEPCRNKHLYTNTVACHQGARLLVLDVISSTSASSVTFGREERTAGLGIVRTQ